MIAFKDAVIRRGFDSVLFDCDSTLTKIEGIDELAALKEVYEQVSRITDETMEGRLDFQSALEKRLAIIKPTKIELLQIGRKYIDEVVDGACELIGLLQRSGKKVYILSGGFMESVRIFSEYLGVESNNVFANEIFFDIDGNYKGFEKKSPVARSNGKKEIIKTIGGSKVMVGDGASDLETKSVVDLFIGYCGVRKRQIIEDKADIVVYDQNMMSLAPLIMDSNSGYGLSAQIKFNRIELAKKYKVT